MKTDGSSVHLHLVQWAVILINVSRAGIATIDGISVLGDSKLCIVAFTSDRFHVYRVADEMKVTRG